MVFAAVAHDDAMGRIRDARILGGKIVPAEKFMEMRKNQYSFLCNLIAHVDDELAERGEVFPEIVDAELRAIKDPE